LNVGRSDKISCSSNRLAGDEEMSGNATVHPITIDLNEFKLHVALKTRLELTLHFNSPSRRFYLSVIALVVNEMRRLGKIAPIPLNTHHDLLALLNDTIGGSAGSSEKKSLLSRIYRKWQHALPNLEEAPLFTVLGRRKGYEEGTGRSYHVTEAERDSWANLFEYKGSHENARLKFAVDKLGATLNDVVILYDGSGNAEAWERFVSSLKGDEQIRTSETGITGLSPLEPAKPLDGSKKDQGIAVTLEENALGWKPAPGLSIPGHRHWVLESQLGTGGAGEVWLAANVNTRVKHVFKFCFEPERIRSIKREVVLLRLLKETLGDRDDIARVIDWELGNPPYYIETEYTEGGDLKAWAANQGGIEEVPLETRLELVAQTAVALAAAHGAGVLHKDIKPTNILISRTKDGRWPRASLADFGIGLLADPEALKKKGITATGLTQTLRGRGSSSTSGTPMYMAPELIEGKPPTAQADIYSLGVLLYQMVIGDLSRALASGWEQDVKDELLGEDIAACVSRARENRLADPAELAERLRTLKERRVQRVIEYQTLKRQQISARRRRILKKVFYYSATIIAVLAVVTVATVLVKQALLHSSQKAWAKEKALPEIKDLLDAGNHTAAYFLARKAEKIIPEDATVREYIEKSTATIDIETTPPGATVSYKPYTDAEGEFIEVGVTPIKAVGLPIGTHRWQIRKAGYQVREMARRIEPSDWWTQEQKAVYFPISWERYTLQFGLFAEDGVPQGTIGVDRGRFAMELWGVPDILRRRALDHFFIDLTEVTNRAYKEFIDVGGYFRPEFWNEEFKKEGQGISWAEAVKSFVDRTGRPGPSTWELGDYPLGQDDYPVSGVSWFEAAAYARFRKKSLPTIYHWYRAALAQHEISDPLTPWIIPASNLQGTGPAKVGTYLGIGSSGAKDMAGNVREWCWNAAGENRYSLGGKWDDPSYMFTQSIVLSPWDRSPGNGFRCAVYPQGTSVASELLKEINLALHDPHGIPPFSEKALGQWRSAVSYEHTPLHPVLEARDEKARDWKRETVSIDAAYDSERLIIHLYLPATGAPPYKTVIYFPGRDCLYLPVFTLNTSMVPWDCMPKSGRAFIVPVYSGTWERGGIGRERSIEEIFRLWPKWTKDIGRTIDYLETRQDMDTENLAYMGFSFGAQISLRFSVAEERIRILILLAGGTLFPAAFPKPPEVEFSYVKVPVLMLNGKYDYIFPVATAQKPLFDLFGTPPEHKRHIIYDAGHAPLPRAECIRDILDWLDRYQGSSKGKVN
jgi:eukaryotic-like serine/threonine-protein kinase